jgi:hypothetical protein
MYQKHMRNSFSHSPVVIVGGGVAGLVPGREPDAIPVSGALSFDFYFGQPIQEYCQATETL